MNTRVRSVIAAMVALFAFAASLRADPKPADPFVETVRRVRPSVVGIGSYYFKDTPTVVYQGTGFVFGDGRLIATNAHVVAAVRSRDRIEQMKAFFPDGSIEGRKVTLLGEDKFHDVAILALDGPPAPALSLDLSTAPQQGESVGILGYPIGLQLGLVPAAHRGVVAAVVPAVLPLPKGAKLTPELTEALRRPYMLFQLDLVVFPGNSGSPLFNGNGDVVGIINKTLAAKTREHLLDTPSGIAYAVPVRWIEELRRQVQGTRGTPGGGSR